MAVYVCTNQGCQFVFERAGEVDSCVVCGYMNIRDATAAEVERLRYNNDKQLGDSEE